MTKKKIAIFGGGISGLTTAWELSSIKNWQDQYEIHLYQSGWRCGGKATTGLGEEGRVEERGIHMFQGWYDNAFRMVQEVYEYIAEHNLNPDGAFQTWRDGFNPNPVTSMVEQDKNGNWIDWPFVFPDNDRIPGSGEPMSSSVLIKEFIALGLEVLIGSPYQENASGKVGFWNDLLAHLFFDQPIAEEKVKKYSALEKLALRFAKKLSIREGKYNHTKRFKTLEEKIDELERLDDRVDLAEDLIKYSDRIVKLLNTWFFKLLFKGNHLRRISEIVQLSLVCIEGVFKDVYDVKTGKYEWENINHYDFSDWLKMNGASEQVINSAIVRFLYKGTFANKYNGEKGTVAADIAVRMMLMIPSYKGSFVWNLRGGTGGTFTAPLYVALEDRGVNFHFFHHLDEVKYSETDEIEEIIVGKQVDLKEGLTKYQPLVKQKGLFQWTLHPDLSQINEEQAAEIKEKDIDIESHWSGWENVESLELKKGRDFDVAVLATSIKPLEYICSEIMAKKPKWKNMVEKVKATATLNVQFWLNEDIEGLGMDLGEWGMKEGSYANTVIYEDPLYSWTSMTYIAPYENWKPESEAKQISYWCGTWPTNYPEPPRSNTNYPKDQITLLKKVSEDWMDKHMGWFWPKARKNNKFDYSLLCDKNMDADPMEKFNNQCFVTNMDPSMHYVLAQPGTNKYRLKTDETEYKNLYFTGDWINFGLNVGYMEGTVISGIQAADKILTNSLQKSIERQHALLGVIEE
ncbi:NAD(P)-binding protein [Flammeovirga aprica]|uniref:NAD(P)-binding protein n=1 Tax=Flammeovirga aprica JL-4 TaxID=694437 RepID=A0A7X9RYR3_9BACT|nr:NAD(P)-binding protein [Flammeovirga aprica]NME71149.1 NAD(P)-binding protein [Flammeovirga aprica JL-4]